MILVRPRGAVAAGCPGQGKRGHRVKRLAGIGPVQIRQVVIKSGLGRDGNAIGPASILTPPLMAITDPSGGNLAASRAFLSDRSLQWTFRALWCAHNCIIPSEPCRLRPSGRGAPIASMRTACAPGGCAQLGASMRVMRLF